MAPFPLPIPAAFIDSARACFERAAQRAGLRRRNIAIGSLKLRLLFAGDRIHALMFPALAHLETAGDGPAALEACFFDSESSATPMPPPPWDQQDYTNRGEIHGYNDGRVHVTYQPGVDILNCLDSDRGLAVYWAPTWKLIPYWERSFPLRTILNWWLKGQPYQPLHAGAVGYPEGGVLIAGESGSGKTTTTLACLASDLRYAGDDYVLAATDPPARVYSLYNTAKLDDGGLARFPALARHLDNPHRCGDEKALIFLHQVDPARLVREFPLRAIVCPRVTGERDTRLQPARNLDAFLAIAPTTAGHLAGARRQTVEKLLRLTRSVPCFTLQAGTDLAQIPVAIARLIRELG